MTTTSETKDLVIVGGGPAGMAAALVAGRARLDTIVVNAESPRNAVSHASHGFLTRDGAHAGELLEAAKQQLVRYGSVEYLVDRVTGVEKNADTFTVEASEGRTWTTRRLLLATGYRDELARLEIPDIESVYGRSVFPCPFCDGFEHADQRLAVFAREPTEHHISLVRVWSEALVVFTNGHALASPLRAGLQGRGIRIEERPITALRSEAGRLRAVCLDGGAAIERDAGFIGDEYAFPTTRFADDLGVRRTTNQMGRSVLEADDLGVTSVDRLYVAGDLKSWWAGLTGSARDGSACATHIVHEIAAERWAAKSPG